MVVDLRIAHLAFEKRSVKGEKMFSCVEKQKKRQDCIPLFKECL